MPVLPFWSTKFHLSVIATCRSNSSSLMPTVLALAIGQLMKQLMGLELDPPQAPYETMLFPNKDLEDSFGPSGSVDDGGTIDG